VESLGPVDRRPQQEQSLVLPQLAQRPLSLAADADEILYASSSSPLCGVGVGAERVRKKADVQSSVAELEKAFLTAATPHGACRTASRRARQCAGPANRGD